MPNGTKHLNLAMGRRPWIARVGPGWLQVRSSGDLSQSRWKREEQGWEGRRGPSIAALKTKPGIGSGSWDRPPRPPDTRREERGSQSHKHKELNSGRNSTERGDRSALETQEGTLPCQQPPSLVGPGRTRDPQSCPFSPSMVRVTL